MDANVVSVGIGASGVFVGGIIGWFTARTLRSRDERRQTYVRWLTFGYQIPYRAMEVARAHGVDVTVAEALRSELAELRALVLIDASEETRRILRKEWDDALEDFAHRQEELRNRKGASALKMLEQAHEETILPVLDKLAAHVRRELHGRLRSHR